MRSALLRASAQNVIEYGLIVATIALVVLIGTLSFGQIVEPWFSILAARIITVGT